ncbi:MAG TPA: tripartite tricarboxylate transporter substrate binding protein [Burkholderiales bacterium]|nr:tripartite tricarboxylate transporter substrate binding protein [Burkholderiales bacterium]
MQPAAALARRSAKLARSVLVLCLSAYAPFASAAYPEKPVRLVVPSVPGGGTDTTMRIIAPKLGDSLGQQVVIENRGGAAGNIGAEVVARSAPDGYTLLAMIASHTINPHIQAKVSFDVEKDFAPVSLAVTLPNVLLSNPSLPTRTLQDLIGFIRARPGQLQYASAGFGSNPHLMMELFASMAGLKMVHVPYKGIAPAFTDVIAGYVHVMAGNILSALPHVRSGRIRAYGVTSATRSKGAPEIPTLSEAGVPGYDAVQWFGLAAPAGTPRDIVVKLHGAVLHALNDPAVSQRFVSGGADPKPSKSPEDFAAYIHAEHVKWGKVIRSAGLKPQ